MCCWAVIGLNCRAGWGISQIPVHTSSLRQIRSVTGLASQVSMHWIYCNCTTFFSFNLFANTSYIHRLTFTYILNVCKNAYWQMLLHKVTYLYSAFQSIIFLQDLNPQDLWWPIGSLTIRCLTPAKTLISLKFSAIWSLDLWLVMSVHGTFVIMQMSQQPPVIL